MKKILLMLYTALLFKAAGANNITVSSATLSGQNITAHSEEINFNVGWDNSWRTSINESNYDGAWLFIKFRKMGTTDWRHCTLSTTGFTVGTGGTVTVPTDGKGAFIYRTADGIGNVSYTGNKLIWNYGIDGILDNETVEVRVFALEMVYIPQGSFQLGSGGSETNAFMDGTSNTSYLVANNNAIQLGTTAGTLNPNGQGLATGTIPAAFPKGFLPFWIMKYECSQQQYVDFLNHLDLARANTNNTNVGGAFTGTHPNFVASQPERALGNLGTFRTAALADWSGLRPYSELEYEKICRGYNTPAVPNEYAWGNTTINNLITVTTAGTSTETVATPANANANTAGAYSFPVRVGLFARTTGSDRILSGGAYYGVMNMSDNMQEVVFSTVNATGKAIDATVNGDGYLDATGNSNISAWAPFGAYGIKGSSYSTGITQGRISDRVNVNFYTSVYGNDANLANASSRLARTAP